MDDARRAQSDAYLASLIPSLAPRAAYGLDAFTRLLDALGRPHEGARFVHVGGTDGKGSTATIVAAILAAAGYRTGLHVSPHVARLGERAQVDGVPADLDRMRELIAEVRAAAERAGVTPSYFECLWAAALLEFRARATDVNVVEVGLGGLTDATNVIASELQILTTIGLDHTRVLGETKAAILRVKQGIVKPGGQVVSGIREPELQRLLRDHAGRVGATVAFDGSDFEATDVVELRDPAGAPRGVGFTHRDGATRLPGLELSLSGRPQARNATLAVAAALRLRHRWPAVDDGAIRRGLAGVRLPGRMEVVERKPLVIFDGAHNPEKVRWLVAGLKGTFPALRFATVVCYRERPDFWDSLALLATVSAHLILSQAAQGGDTGLEPRVQAPELARAEREFGAERHIPARAALARARELVGAGKGGRGARHGLDLHAAGTLRVVALRRDVAALDVIVDQAAGLHHRVGGRRPDEAEALLLHRLGQRLGLGRRRGRFVARARPRRARLGREGPDQRRQVDVQRRARVGDRRLDLQAVADDPGVGHQPRHVVLAELGHARDLEARERRAEALALAQDRDPRQPGLEGLERHPLVQRPGRSRTGRPHSSSW